MSRCTGCDAKIDCDNCEPIIDVERYSSILEKENATLRSSLAEANTKNETLYEEVRKMKEADIGHARICPQHVKNIDPWVRESDLLKMREKYDLAYAARTRQQSRAEKAESLLLAAGEREKLLRDAVEAAHGYDWESPGRDGYWFSYVRPRVERAYKAISSPASCGFAGESSGLAKEPCSTPIKAESSQSAQEENHSDGGVSWDGREDE